MKWRNSKERELLATGMGSRDQTLPNKNNPNPDLSDAVCDRNQSASPGSTSSSEAKASGGGGAAAAVSGTLASESPVRDDSGVSGVAHGNDMSVNGYGAESASQTAFLANIYNSKLSSYPSMKSQTYNKAAADYDDTSDSSMNSDEEINVT